MERMMRIQLIPLIKWLFSNREDPRPCLYYPTDGWVTDPKEVERIMRERGLEL